MLAGAAAFAMPAQEHRAPNIVFILADDLGYGDLGCYGQRVLQTPRLDRLAREGVRCTNAYAGGAVCAPSRCSLMTGLHQGHARIRGNLITVDAALSRDDVTVAKVLKRAGYKTGLFGKWHLGSPSSTGHPLDHGFDEFFGFHSGKHAQIYYPHHIWDGRSEFFLDANRGGTALNYSQDLVMDRALAFLQRNARDPFFLFLATQLVHADSERGRRLGDGMVVPTYGEFASKPWPAPEKGFAAMLSRLDSDAGRVIDKLVELGIANDTLVVFTSDNGPHAEGGHKPEFFRSSGTLRGYKRDLYEGGIRVPFIARWPGRASAGSICDEPFAFYDLLPTLAEISGSSIPNGLDGISYAPSLTNGVQRGKHDFLYWESYEGGFHQAVRFHDWKAIRHNFGPIEIYDLRSDVTETKNLAHSETERVRLAESMMKQAHVDSALFPVRKESR